MVFAFGRALALALALFADFAVPAIAAEDCPYHPTPSAALAGVSVVGAYEAVLKMRRTGRPEGLRHPRDDHRQ